MGIINVRKEQIAIEDIRVGTGTFSRTTSTGGSQTLNKVNLGVLTTSVTTFDDGDTTPSVDKNHLFKTANTSATTITDFNDGVTGQVIWVIFGDALTTIDFNSATNLKGNQASNWTAANGDHLQAVYDGTSWYCIISDNVA